MLAEPVQHEEGPAADIEQGAGRRLADWLDRVGSRPMPVYTCALAELEHEAPDAEPDDEAQSTRCHGATRIRGPQGSSRSG